MRTHNKNKRQTGKQGKLLAEERKIPFHRTRQFDMAMAAVVSTNPRLRVLRLPWCRLFDGHIDRAVHSAHGSASKKSSHARTAIVNFR